MASLRSVLLVLEAVICFGSLTPPLLVGLLVVPGLVATDPLELESYGMLALLSGGLFGLYGVVTLLRLILGSPVRVSRAVLLAALASGLCAAAGAAWLLLEPGKRLSVLGLPLAATVHFTWLGRRHLLAPASGVDGSSPDHTPRVE